MAIGAILADGLMFPKQRAALISMARIAKIRNAHVAQHIRTRRAVRVVAIRADHLALANRVVRVLQGQRALFGMAAEANLRLRRLNQYRILGNMDRVAAYTGEVIDLMLASDPRRMIGILVATETDLIAHGDG